MGWYIFAFFSGLVIGGGGIGFLAYKYKAQLTALEDRYVK